VLSKEEKEEMLRDAKSKRRMGSLKPRPGEKRAKISYDEYLSFLNSVQEIFSPFKTSVTPTLTKFNKL